MSNKPLKHSDLKKEWLKPRTERNILVQPEYHLIVTEGTKTEPNYFEGMKSAINLKDKGRYRGKVQIQIEGEGMNTLSLLKRAEDYVQKSQNNIKHVWIVYDKDNFPSDDFDNTEERCKALSTEEVQYHALWSNQCIEIWFLLHFIYTDSDMHREEYYPKLSACLQRLGIEKYAKNRDDIFQILLPYLNDAIRNSKALIASKGENIPSRTSPGTKIYEIFEKLHKYL